MRNNYQLLKKELKNRFRQVENPKTFSAIFAARQQRATESVEDFAADLKKIYDKAYARRDSRTREEDLLRKFLEGLKDTKASFHVEFVKDPKNIDSAVDEVINFQEVHKKQSSAMRRIGIDDELSSEEEYEYTVARVAGRPLDRNIKQVSRRELEARIAAMKKQLEDLNENDPPTESPQNRCNQSSNQQHATGWSPGCFICGQIGHIRRDCPFNEPVDQTPTTVNPTMKPGNKQIRKGVTPSGN